MTPIETVVFFALVLSLAVSVGYSDEEFEENTSRTIPTETEMYELWAKWLKKLDKKSLLAGCGLTNAVFDSEYSFN